MALEFQKFVPRPVEAFILKSAEQVPDFVSYLLYGKRPAPADFPRDGIFPHYDITLTPGGDLVRVDLRDGRTLKRGSTIVRRGRHTELLENCEEFAKEWELAESPSAPVDEVTDKTDLEVAHEWAEQCDWFQRVTWVSGGYCITADFRDGEFKQASLSCPDDGNYLLSETDRFQKFKGWLKPPQNAGAND